MQISYLDVWEPSIDLAESIYYTLNVPVKNSLKNFKLAHGILSFNNYIC